MLAKAHFKANVIISGCCPAVVRLSGGGRRTECPAPSGVVRPALSGVAFGAVRRRPALSGVVRRRFFTGVRRCPASLLDSFWLAPFSFCFGLYRELN